MRLEYIVTENEIMVKEYLKFLKFSRNYGKKIKLYGKIIVNGEEVKNHYLLHKNDKLVLLLEEDLNENIVPTNIKLDIVFEDEYLLIINKPINISCQPSRKHLEDNIISALKNYFLSNHINSNIHLVNRLDYATSGVMMIGKSGVIHQKMQENVDRVYLCKVHGIVFPLSGTIDAGIKRVKETSILREIAEDGKKAITHYQVIEHNEQEDYSIVLCKLETGRTHQIRLHMKYINHPIYGDKLYGCDNENNLYLHSTIISFTHPITNEKIRLINKPIWYKGDINA